MAGLGPVVTALWKELGMAPPFERIGESFEFELGSVAFRLQVADDGDTILARGRIGWLEGNPHEAGDQLGRALRLGLALTALNPAVLDASEAEDILEQGHEGPVPVYAVARASVSVPASILPAVSAVLDWQSATSGILTQTSDGESEPQPRRGADRAGPDAEMIIFQP